MTPLDSATPAQATGARANTKPEPLLDAVIALTERGLLPDSIVRAGIRRLCAQRLADYDRLTPEELQETEHKYLAGLLASPIAVHTTDANRQHYELPAEFFELVLGRHKKYSSAFFAKPGSSLEDAEREALDQTIARAQLEDGMSILELGCGWGSLTLEMARRFPRSKIVALSNSHSQREYIGARAKEAGLENVQLVTRDITGASDLAAEFGHFDRVVSVEMFEHLRNYELLLKRISSWLKPDGKLFVHIFTHREHSYLFETDGSDNWMGKYFFTGGQMPSRYLLRSFQNDLSLERQWTWSGQHYAKTADAWLANLDRNRAAVLALMEATYGVSESDRWLHRWRVFFMSCSELFGFREGSEWFVSHYLFSNKRGAE